MTSSESPSWIIDLHAWSVGSKAPWLDGMVEHARLATSMRIRSLEVDALSLSLPSPCQSSSLQLEFSVNDTFEPSPKGGGIELQLDRLLERIAEETLAIPMAVFWRTDGEGPMLKGIKQGRAQNLALIQEETLLDEQLGEYFYDFMAIPDQARTLGQRLFNCLLSSPGAQEAMAPLRAAALDHDWPTSTRPSLKPRV